MARKFEAKIITVAEIRCGICGGAEAIDIEDVPQNYNRLDYASDVFERNGWSRARLRIHEGDESIHPVCPNCTKTRNSLANSSPDFAVAVQRQAVDL